ncbi:MAG: general stress protein [Candidatus Levybacteria bacterium]|nr:general stress protein [Candidatus Levybacteria bacterium]
MTKTLLGVFTEKSDVEEAIEKLQANGLDTKDFSIVMKDAKEAKDISDDTGANVAGGALSGATTGAAIGGIAGFLAGTVLPGLGGFLIGGPIGAALGLTGAAATTVSGAATGAIAGGLIGALMGLGLSKEDAEHYETQVKEGAILLIVPTQDAKVSFVNDVFNQYHASDIKTIAQSSDTIGKTTNSSTNDSDYQNQSHQQTHHFATMGAKGGKTTKKTSSHDGRGWHDDSTEHAKAGKGEKIKE